MTSSIGLKSVVSIITLECVNCKKKHTFKTITDYWKDWKWCPYCKNKLMEVKADGTTTDGIPSKTKVLGILPNEL